MNLKHISIYILLFFSIQKSYSQNYFVNGDASVTSVDGCYQLTSSSNWELGSVWYANKLDLSKSFDLEFELYFGDKDNGADGIVFVLQTAGNNALGLPGGGLGFEGFSPSLGIEFDDWNNQDLGDIPADHIAILKNGSVNHNGTDAISAPVAAIESNGNIEDGQNHLVRITWNAQLSLLEVWFDCKIRQSITTDIIDSIFDGKTSVFWGFTSSTGGANNTHIACLSDNIYVSDSLFICAGQEIQLNSRKSSNEQYTWDPNVFLDDNSIQNPVCDALETTTYHVSYLDQCNQKQVDTVVVNVSDRPTLDSINDIELCIGEAFSIELNNPFGEVFWNDIPGLDSYELFDYNGSLEIRSYNDCGADSITIEISTVDCKCAMWFPNVFTPDNDGINDYFGPVDGCNNLSDYVLKIYNRWGEKVFETNEIANFWDGKSRGMGSPHGVYFWVASWNLSSDNKTEDTIQNGLIELLR